MSIYLLTIKAYLSDRTVTCISQSFTCKMAAKNSWHGCYIMVLVTHIYMPDERCVTVCVCVCVCYMWV